MTAVALCDSPKFLLPLLIAFVGVYLKDYYNTPPSWDDIHFQTNVVDQRFKAVAETFKLNLYEEWERDGGAFVLYYKGEKVLDIWGGYADRESRRLWKEDTMNVAFSSSKAMGALCVAKLVDEGHLTYENRVAEFWPEFAKHGKENITVQWVMSHMSGLAWTDNQIDLETAKDPAKIAKVFESQKPQWEAGKQIGYHALNYGWLVDQIIRRSDPNRRGVGQFWKDEFQTKHDLDFHLGLPRELTYRVSRLTKPTAMDALREYWTKPSDFKIGRILHQWFTDGPLMKVNRNAPFIDLLRVPLNNPELFQLEQPAVLGIGTARSMAEIFEKMRIGQLFSAEVTKKLTTPFARSEDLVTGANLARGQGLMFRDFTHNGKTHWQIGHSGFGGQNVRVDLDNEITFAYMSNGLKVGFGDTARTYKRLVASLYDTLESLRK